MANYKVIEAANASDASKVKKAVAAKGWKIVSQINDSGRIVMTFDISGAYNRTDEEARGLRLATWIISIIELVASGILFIALMSSIATNAPLVDNPQYISGGIDYARSAILVASIFLVLSAASIVINAFGVKLLRKTKNYNALLALGIVGIVSIIGLVTGIFMLITRSKCMKYNQPARPAR